VIIILAGPVEGGSHKTAPGQTHLQMQNDLFCAAFAIKLYEPPVA
jgi:hypothetical protein